MAVTMPGQWRHSSMIGISCMAVESARSVRSSDRLGGSPDSSRSIIFSKRDLAIASIPKAENILRKMS